MTPKSFLINFKSLKTIKILGSFILLGLMLFLAVVTPPMIIWGIEEGFSHFSNKKVELTDKERAEGVLIDAPDRVKYDKYNYEHWGDCISPTSKEGWTLTPFDIRYKDLEAGKTYNFTATLGRSYGRPNEGENIDEIKGSFTPADSEGSVEYVFYTNPKWVKDGKYTILLELDE